MTLYEALEVRASGLARLTDEVAPIANLVQTVAMGAARWAHRTHCDVVTAGMSADAGSDLFTLRLYRPKTGIVVPVFRSAIATTYETAARFVRVHPDAIDVLHVLVTWALVHVARGTSRFDGRWAPGDGGFLAINAVPALVKSA